MRRMDRIDILGQDVYKEMCIYYLVLNIAGARPLPLIELQLLKSETSKVYTYGSMFPRVRYVESACCGSTSITVHILPVGSRSFFLNCRIYRGQHGSYHPALEILVPCSGYVAGLALHFTE